jgi:potassium-transporting ATPase KdpC subunit
MRTAMLKHLRPAFSFVVLMAVLTGVLYPLAMTGLAQVLFPKQASGSLIEKNGKIVGSLLIGQNFTSDKYFHGRPSATTGTDPADSSKTIPSPYNAASSGGSNLGPTSQSLIDGIKAEATHQRDENDKALVPVDLVTNSGSGLDPDITPASAQFQISRVAKARSMNEAEIKTIVSKNTQARHFGFLGEKCVNVLLLNIDLDEAQKTSIQ